MKRLSISILSVVLVGVSSFMLPLFAEASTASDLRLSHAEAREAVSEMLSDPSLQSNSENLNNVIELLRSYRNESVSGIPSIQEGPFIGYVLQNQLLPSWQSLYDSQYKEQHKKFVEDITYEGLFDFLMKAIVANQLPPQLKKTGDQIGSCLANRIEEGIDVPGAGNPSCPLDNSDTIPHGFAKPSTLQLAWMKYTCWLPFVTSPCEARKAVYAVAKEQLVEAKKKNLMDQVFPEIFPQMFRSSIIDGVNEKRAQISEILSRKFKAKVDRRFWKYAPVLDLQDGDGRVSGIREFAEGLSVDIRAATVFADSAPELAAPLLYAAANRLVVAMGGTEARWDGDQFKLADDQPDAPDAKDKKAAPRFETQGFGGLGVIRSAKGESAAAWDLAGYDPTAANPTPLELFPEKFTLGAENTITPMTGEATRETLGDLGVLMNSVMDFLELTSSQSKLAPHFVPSTDLNRILNDDDPAIFPQEGRQLAVGLIAAAIKNMIAPQGHLILPAQHSSVLDSPADDGHSGLFGLRFYEAINLSGRLDTPVPIVSLASFFNSISRLTQLISTGDPAVPQALVSLKSTMDQAVELSAFTMISRAQQSDGGFVDNLGDKVGTRNLLTQAAALQALTEVYNQTHTPALRLSIREAWRFMDHFWASTGGSGNELPLMSVVGAGQPQGDTLQSIPALWRILNLWNQTQTSAVFADLMNPALDNEWGKAGWDKWQQRFGALRQSLYRQLDHPSDSTL